MFMYSNLDKTKFPIYHRGTYLIQYRGVTDKSYTPTPRTVLAFISSHNPGGNSITLVNLLPTSLI